VRRLVDLPTSVNEQRAFRAFPSQKLRKWQGNVQTAPARMRKPSGIFLVFTARTLTNSCGTYAYT
jgi:hypothetical protein